MMKVSTETTSQRHWRERFGPWALVTGASGGIGRAFAVDLARRGLNLALVARRGDLLSELAARLASQHGIQTLVLPSDLSRPDAIPRILSETGHLDIGLLVAAAGFGASGPFLDADLDQELNMLDVNCRAVAALSHAFGRRLARRGRGGLVLLSSLVAFQGVPRAANYSATKAFVQSLAEALHLELKPLGVDVIASAPGPVYSGFAARANMRMSMGAQPDQVAQATLDALGHTSTFRPGWLAKFLEFSLSLLPRRGRVRIMSLVMGGMTRHQNGETKAQARGSA